MKAIEILKDLSMEAKRMANPNFPANYLPATKYSDSTANGLTKCIKDFLNLSGHQAERINTMGVFVKGTSKNHGHLANEVNNGKYIPTTGTKGSADISATILGRSVKIEVKMNDAQSTAQKEYQLAIEKAHGVYKIFRNFEDFYEWYIIYIKSINNN